MTPAELLTDAFDRILKTATAAVHGLTDEQLVARPAVDANSVAWLVWHLARVQDDHVADAAGTEQVWTAQDFVSRFDLPFDSGATGFGMSSEDVSHVRAGVGPALIHAKVTRPYSHSAADTQSKYRLPQELVWETEHDPIDRLERTLVDGGILTTAEAADIRAEAKRIVGAAAKAALAAPRPDVTTVLDHVVALPDIPDPGDPPAGGGPVGAIERDAPYRPEDA